jgi:hypothetical protein
VGASAPERPRVDHPVDRPELYAPKGVQVTGTNGRQLDHFYRSPSHENRVLDDGRGSVGPVWPPREAEASGGSAGPRVEPHSSLVKYSPGRLYRPAGAFVGGHTRRVTPVPIPNTVVKPAGPMILLQRESRSPPALNGSPRDRKVSGASCLCGRSGGLAVSHVCRGAHSWRARV